MKVTYAMLKKEDAWGVRVSEGEVEEGDEVTVTKRDGSTKKEIVDQIVWEGEDRDGLKVQLCTILRDGAPAPREARQDAPKATPPRFVPERQAGEDDDSDIPF